MEDDKDWARKVTAANALASLILRLWQTASSTVPCAGFGSWALPELQGGTADMILAMQQNRDLQGTGSGRWCRVHPSSEESDSSRSLVSLGSNSSNPQPSHLRAISYHISLPLFPIAMLGKKELDSRSWEKLQAAHSPKDLEKAIRKFLDICVGNTFPRRLMERQDPLCHHCLTIVIDSAM